MNVQFMMKIKKSMLRGGFLKAFALILALLSLTPLSGQEPVPVEVSDQRAAMGGKQYFIHEVLRGQTLYSISKAYKVTIEQIRSENVIADNGIQEGQKLRIPVAAELQKRGGNVVPAPVRDTVPPRQQPAAGERTSGIPVGEPAAEQGDEK